MKLKCSLCPKEAVGLEGHVGRRHQACGDRKKGSGTKRVGGHWGRKTTTN